MANLKRASQQLFSRPNDERFESFEALQSHCNRMKECSTLHWQLPTEFTPCPMGLELGLQIGGNGIHSLNDWSFGQLCSLATVQRETVNRLGADTASRVLRETIPLNGKPLQLLTQGQTLRSIHGASYTRMFDADLLEMVRNEATGFHALSIAVENWSSFAGWLWVAAIFCSRVGCVPIRVMGLFSTSIKTPR